MNKILLLITLFLAIKTMNSQLCNGTLGAPIRNLTFGSGTANPGGTLATIVPGATTSYTYRNGGIPVDGEYSIVNQIPGNPAWFNGASDHTDDNNGYMIFFNSAPTAGVFYNETITNLCIGTSYEFSAWIANALRLSFQSNLPISAPNISFTIRDVTTNAIIAQTSTGNMQRFNTLTWIQQGMTFTAPSTSVKLELSNANVGGANTPGNDLVIDDITFRPCIVDENQTVCIQNGLILLSPNGVNWSTSSPNNLTSQNGNIYFNPSTSGEGYFELVSPCRTIKLTVVNCCEDPCSWSKTGNGNINPGHFIGTKNNADLNFKTNNNLNLKLHNSGHLILNEGKSLMFGKLTNSAAEPKWGIENFNNGLNFYKPWPSANAGDYFLFLSDNNKVGIGTSTPAQRLHVAGNIQANATVYTSDIRYKKEIKNLENQLDIINKLSSKSYQWKSEEFKDRNFDDKLQFGFIAQEIETVLPNLVYTDADGFKSVNYTSLIPVMTQAIKELNTKVEKQNSAVVENDQLKTEVEALKAENLMFREKFALLEKSIAQICENGCAGLEKKTIESNILYQSIPNPTDDIALINYFLTNNVKSAKISIYTPEGKDIENFQLETTSGNGSVKVSLGNLSSGTYMYSLIVDEKLVDTKRIQIVK